MTLWPITVTLNGAAVALDEVEAAVVIRHGRGDAFDAPQPSSAQITLLGVTRAYTKPFRIGGALAIDAHDGATTAPRFRGTVTDARLEDDELTVIAAGPLSTLWRYTVGADAGAWPAEPWSARVTRVFTEAGLASLLVLEAGAFNPGLAAHNPAPYGLDAYLAALADDVGAAVVDLPDGRILVQSIDSRSSSSPLMLDPADVLYSPPWDQALTVANLVTVAYSGGSVSASDPASIADFGTLPLDIQTDIAGATDAQTRANQAIARRAFPRWKMLEAPILAGYQALRVGKVVGLSSLPASAPYGTWYPVLEGWEDRINGDAWQMLLTLSDPELSGVILRWADVPSTPAYRWNTIDQTVAWRDAITLGDLQP